MLAQCVRYLSAAVTIKHGKQENVLCKIAAMIPLLKGEPVFLVGASILGGQRKRAQRIWDEQR